MDMEDDDEFGDLYADVIRPVSPPRPPPVVPSTAPTPSPTSPPNPFLGSREEEDDQNQILHGDSRPSCPPSSPPDSSVPTHAPDPGADGDEDWILGPAPATEEQSLDWNEEEDAGLARVLTKDLAADGAGVTVELGGGGGEARVLGTPSKKVKADGDEVNNHECDEIKVLEEDLDPFLGGGTGKKMEMDTAMEDLDEEPVIPGLSFNGMNGGDIRVSGSDDWDSDSEDDLQIVLNDNNLGHLGGERNKGAGIDDEDDEDGEEDLVIVTDEDQHHLHHQAADDQDWGEESMQPALEGERKEISEAAKANGVINPVAGARTGYSGHGFHPQHHTQFKYVRPGAAAAPGGATGHIRPPLPMGPIAGRGRGAPKNFQSGYGLPVWANNTSARAFGSGLEFTLPSHKTVFDVDIDAFEEKPWRHPGVDITDFFNFGLDENNWKDYCKQLDQLRLESTMQSKIHVYESGRSEQDYDPDLPPELAAATGLQDVTTENTHLGKVDCEQEDLFGQGRGAARIRAQLPTGRAIQVEGGFGERLPSIDTRPPRIRDSDAIIEIPLQDSVDDSINSNGALEEPENDLRGEYTKGEIPEVEEHDRRADSDYVDRFPHSYNGKKRDIATRRVSSGGSVHNAVEGNGILPFPPEAPLQYHISSKMQSPAHPDGFFGTPHRGRLTRGTSCERSIDAIPRQSTQANRNDGQKEKSGDSVEGNRTSEMSSPVAVEIPGDLSIELRDNEHDDMLALGDSTEVEGEEVASDVQVSGETHEDTSSLRSVQKQKLSSRVEHPAVHENGDGDDLRTRHSNNSRTKSGTGKDYLRRYDGVEEVMQDGWSRRIGDSGRHHSEEQRSLRRRDDNGRDGKHEVDRHRLSLKGREDLYQSHPQRDRNSNPAHYSHRSEGFERPREKDDSVVVRQKREDNVHGKRVTVEETKHEYGEEIGSRHRSKDRISDRRGKGEDLYSRKRIDDGDWRGRHDREGGPRHRERDDIFMSWSEILDDNHIKKRKDEEHQRGGKVTKEDSLHGYKAREDTSRSRKERDDGLDYRRREDLARVREKSEDHYSSRHRDESWRQKEREDRQRLKQPHEDTQAHRERDDGRGTTKGGRLLEDKALGGNKRTRDEAKGIGSDKDYPHKDRRRQNEQPKRERAEAESLSKHKGRLEMHSHENQFHDERIPRNERLGSHNEYTSGASNSQQIHRERHRENSRKSKETEGGEQNSLGGGKRKHEDKAHRNEKASMEGNGELEINHVSSAVLVKNFQSHTDEQQDVPQQQHSSKIPGEEDAAFDDENQTDSRRRRSKLERWTSHKERDNADGDNMDNADKAQSDEATKNEGDDVCDTDPMDADVAQISDRMGDEQDRHLETVAKLKKRSERFKLPMPGEKDVTLSKKVDNELKDATDAEIKQERPARKRRWISS